MPQIVLTRAGEIINRWIPDAVPSELEGFKWPKTVQDALNASDAAYIAIDVATQEHELADGVLNVEAPQRDTQALRAAIRASKQNPGTPHTDAAKRDEELAWQALEVAIEDSRIPMQGAIDAVAEYVKTHPDKLAAYELGQWDLAVKAQEQAAKAAIEAENARRAIGRVYTHSRWFSGEHFAPEPFLVAGDNFNDLSNEQVRSRYESMRDGVEDTTGVQKGRLGRFDVAAHA